MALTSANLRTRMDREFKLLGITSTMTDEKNDIIDDALSEFVSYMDKPIISATLAVTAGTTRYDMPATIRKIQDVRDADGDSVVYSEDLTAVQIVLQDDPTSGNYTVYGTPEDVETNRDTIVAAIRTQYKRVLWAFVRWSTYAWAHNDKATNMLKEARFLANSERKSQNRRMDDVNTTVQSKDTTGQNIEDVGNVEGRDVNISNLFESDL